MPDTPFHIDASDGRITLPNGLVISADLTQDALKAAPQAAAAKGFDRGTRPFLHYQLTGGQIDGKTLLVGLIFYDQLLLQVSMTVNQYPPQARDWSSYSLDTEADIKRFHDTLLQGMLGKPTEQFDFSSWDKPPRQQALYTALKWQYEWGSVHSGHDFKGGGTEMIVNYGERMEQANREYRAQQRKGR